MKFINETNLYADRTDRLVSKTVINKSMNLNRTDRTDRTDRVAGETANKNNNLIKIDRRDRYQSKLRKSANS